MAVDIMAADIMAAVLWPRGVPSQAAAPTCKEAAKLEFPTDKKARHAYKKECKQAWKAQKA